MTTEDAKEYMNKLEIPQLFESMLTGLLYNKPDDHLKFLGDCISDAKAHSNLKWDTFIDFNKKPLPAIPRTSTGPIRSESFGLVDNLVQTKTFETEPILEMKIQTKLPGIKKDTSDFDISMGNGEDSFTNQENIFVNNEENVLPEMKEKMFSNQKVIFVLGGPGSGKGTQCDKIVEKFGYTHLSAGELLREEINKQTERATLISDAIKEGKLVPQEITIELLRDAMLQHPKSPGFLIDGFPRELGQGHQFENEIVECSMVLYFECSEEAMKERILKRGENSGRTDENTETIKKRFETFFEKTIPVLEHYDSLNKLKKVDATCSVDEIFKSVCVMFDEISSSPMAEKIDQQKNVTSSVENANKFSGQRIVFVLGGPGSGKGTQCDRIVEKFGFAHFSTGDLLRNEVEKDTDRATMMNEIMKEGKLVPQEIIIQLLSDAMLEDSQSPGFLIDGFPRDLGQGKQFNDELAECDLVLFFECSEEAMEGRLLKRGETSGRSDDNSETIKKRFKTYIEETLPVIEYYENSNKVKRVDATRDVEDVFIDVCKIFGVMLEQPIANRQKPKAETNDEELKEAARELFDHLDKIENEQTEANDEGDHQGTTGDDEQGNRTLVEETVITTEELVPLGDLGLPITTGSGLLNVRVIFVIGGPGCGKGTQCAKIVENYGYTHLSTGDLLRSEVESESSRGEALKGMMERGELGPMETILEILRDAIIKQPNTRGFLIDGFPREMCQAIQFEKEIAECECVLYYECSSETMTERLLKRAETSGRVDDNEETIKKRLETFLNQTLPVVEHYEEKQKIHKIQAERTPEEIFNETKSVLDALPPRSSRLRQFDIVFLTGPGSTDAEIGDKLAENNGRTLFSYSELSKQNESEPSNEGDMNENNLNELTTKLTNDNSSGGFLVSGFPYTVEQLEQFQKFSDFKFLLYVESESDESGGIDQNGLNEFLEKIESLEKLRKIPGNLTKEEIINTAQTYFDGYSK